MRSLYLVLTDLGTVQVYAGRGYVMAFEWDVLRVERLEWANVLQPGVARKFHILPHSVAFVSRWMVTRQTEDRTALWVDGGIEWVTDARFAQLCGIQDAPVGDRFWFMPDAIKVTPPVPRVYQRQKPSTWEVRP